MLPLPRGMASLADAALKLLENPSTVGLSLLAPEGRQVRLNASAGVGVNGQPVIV